MRTVWAAALIAVVLGWGGAARAEVTLQVTPVQGGAALEVDFGTTRSLGPEGQEETETVIRQVRLSITSSSGHVYQVFQRVNGPWVGPDGKTIPLESVEFLLAETKTSGTNRFPSPAPMSMGDQEIFLSDPTGTSEDLLITYTVKLPPGQRAGRYRTTLSYRVMAQ